MQLGFHAAMGMGMARALVRKGTDDGRRGLAYGLVLGNVLPDTDFFLLGPLYLVSSELGLQMHRTFTHSLITILLVFAVLYYRSKNSYRQNLALGVAMGMLAHSIVDIFIWFSAVRFFWPLGLFGIPDTINLWSEFHPPELVSALLGAADYLAFALFFWLMGRQALSAGTDGTFLPRVRAFARLSWVLFFVYTIIAFFVNLAVFNILHYAVFILVMLPITLHVIYRMRETIYSLARTGGIVGS